jgi:hypothetical protein
MPNRKDEETMEVVPMPGSEDDSERRRILKSNERDQELERHGERSRHNEGYDEAADGPATPTIERVTDDNE